MLYEVITLPIMEIAQSLLRDMQQRASDDKSRDCVRDQYDRMRALKCWYKTQRNVTAWVAGVHGYLESTDLKVRQECRALLKKMVLDEIENTKDFRITSYNVCYTKLLRLIS